MNIIYEDNHLIAVCKVAGILTQGDHTGSISLYDLVKKYIKEKYHKPGNVYLGMVHRLDKPVSGIILFAKTSKAAGRLSEEFREHTALKLYAALADDKTDLPGGTWIERDEQILRKRGYSEIIAGDKDSGIRAKLRLYKVASSGGKALLLIRLLTGKKHQIRAQLASMGMPIAGDRLYGSAVKTGDGAICLHSYFLAISHPVTKKWEILHSPLPERFNQYMQIDESTNSLMETIAHRELALPEPPRDG